MHLLQGTRVLVTGVNGCIGRAVVEKLGSHGARIIGMDALQIHKEIHSYIERYIEKDIRDLESLGRLVEEADVVVHLAAYVHKKIETEKDVRAAFSVNQESTEKLSEYCEKKSKGIVFTSTVAVFGEEATGHVSDQTPVAPKTPYGISKARAEQAVLKAGGTILRLPMVYGANDKGNMARMIHAIAKGFFVIPGRGEAKRTFVGRWNVAHAVALAIRAGKSKSGIYLVTDDETVTLAELADKIATMLGVRKPIRVPRALIATAAAGGTMLSKLLRRNMPIDWGSYSKLTRDLTFDGTKIRRELGYSPVKSLDEGLREEVEWVKAGMKS